MSTPRNPTKQLLEATAGLLVMASLAGCASGPQVQVTPLTTHSYAPKSLVQTLDAPPAGNYTPIAKLAITGAPGEDRVQLLAALTKKAASLGANAVLITSEKAEVRSSGPVTYNPAGGNYVTAAPKTILHIQADALLLPSAQ